MTEYKINKEPGSIIIDFDTYPFGNGLKNLEITLNQEKFTISKEELAFILKKLKTDGYCS
jgi:hypothetical protein